MSLITLFSAPKPFTDKRIAIIQRNAIGSWIRLRGVQILLMGDEPGLREAAMEFGVKNLREVACNSSGTPLISSMFRLARENSVGGYLGIINSDMILMDDFIEAAQKVMALKDRFVLLSRRWDLDVPEPIDFTEGWEDRLRAATRAAGTLHRPAGSDFFLFPRGCYEDIPDFAIGRAGWDNWMIYKARKEKWPVVDATHSMLLVHQNHDYGHLPGGEPHYAAPESEENIRLAGGAAPIRYTILDATHSLRRHRLARPAWSYLRFMRSVELTLRSILFFLPADMIEEVARPKRWKKRLQRMFGIH